MKNFILKSLSLLICLIISSGIFYSCGTISLTNGKYSFKVHCPPKPFLGIEYEFISGLNKLEGVEFLSGFRVIQLIHNSSAYKAGLKNGDIILSYDSIQVDSLSKEKALGQFEDYIKDHKKNKEKLSLTILKFDENIFAKEDEISNWGNLSTKDLSSIIDTKTKNELNFKIVKIEIILDKQANHIENLPDNEMLFPKFKNIIYNYEDDINSLIVENHLKEKYEKLLKKLIDNEHWDDGFRLNLFRYIHRSPISLPELSDMKTLELEKYSKADNIPGLICQAAELLNLNINKTKIDVKYPESNNPEDHFRFIIKTINRACKYRNKAFKKIKKKDQLLLAENIDALMSELTQSFYAFDQDNTKIETHIKLLKLSHQINYSALFMSAGLLSKLSDQKWLNNFKTSLENYKPNIPLLYEGVAGEVLYVGKTIAGKIIVGGSNTNMYNTDAAVIIDVGGNDLYTGNTGGSDMKKPLTLIIDFKGNDHYNTTRDISTGSGVLGVGMLIDIDGNDIYSSTRYSQGTGIMGIGILADFKGDDIYYASEYTQGTGFWGLGLLVDSKGQDHYTAKLFAQGVGGPKGIGIIMEGNGDDHYYAGGFYPDSHETKGIFKGASQGFGLGFRDYASGGAGIVVDSDGNDKFEAGTFSQGSAYSFGMGILKNSGNNDDEYKSSGFAQGFACNSAIGILIDDGGNDNYSGKIGALQGAAWNFSLSAIVDKSGNDNYNCRNKNFSQGAAKYNSIAFFLDQSGDDTYFFNKKNKITDNSYSDDNSFSFFIDNFGDDNYN